MNRISKIAVIVTAAGLIAACGNTTEAKGTRPKSRCKSFSCKSRVVEPPPVISTETTGENTGPAWGSGSANQPNTAPGRSANPRLPTKPGTENVTVPNVVGSQTDPATRLLDGAGLRWTITPRYVTGPGDAGKVVAQNPTPGSAVIRGYYVGLTVATFDTRYLRVVPDFTGKSEAEVRSTLAGMNLVASVTTVPTGSASNAGARSSVPQKGTTVVVGSTVTVVVAVWQPSVAMPTYVTVPNLVGLGYYAQEVALYPLGLKLGISRFVPNDDVTLDGVCFRQSPAAGAQVLKGSTVSCDQWAWTDPQGV